MLMTLRADIDTESPGPSCTIVSCSLPGLFTYSVIHSRTGSWLLTLYFRLQSNISLGGVISLCGGLEGLLSVFARILPGSALGDCSSHRLCPFDVLSSLWNCVLL